MHIRLLSGFKVSMTSCLEMLRECLCKSGPVDFA